MPGRGRGAHGAAVQKQKILHRVVGDEQIHPAVVVDVRGDDPKALAGGACDIGSPLDPSEGSVSIVVVKEIGRAFEDARNTIIVHARPAVVAKEVVGFSVIDIAADEQVQAAVIIVVEPDGAGCPTRRFHTGAFGDIGKGAVTVVAVKNAVTVGGHEEIGPTVVVVVPDHHPHPERAACYTRRFGDIGKGAVAVVAVERIAQRLGRFVEIAGAAVDQVDVHPAVVVVIEKRTARAYRLGQVTLGRHGIFVHPGNPARGRRHFFKQRPGSTPEPPRQKSAGR